MPANRPYDPRYNAKLYVPKLTEAQRRARATPLESLRRPRPEATAPAVLPPPPQATTPQPEIREVPIAEVPVPEPATQGAPSPDPIPEAWEVVFAQFPEIYPHHATPVLAAVGAPGDQCASTRGNPPSWGARGLGRSITGPRMNATGHELGCDWSGAP